MRVLMFGWEFPPFKSGGLGTACKGMASALAARGTGVVFVLPRTGHRQPQETEPGLTLLSASGTRLHGGLARVRHAGPARGERRFVTGNEWYALDAALRRIWEHRLHLEYIDSPLHPYLTEHVERHGIFPAEPSPCSFHCRVFSFHQRYVSNLRVK